jgi:small GTP-binding protein
MQSTLFAVHNDIQQHDDRHWESPPLFHYATPVHTPSAVPSKPTKVQCLVLGAAGAGKTSLLRRFSHGTFVHEARIPTLGSDFYTGRIQVNDINLQLQLWDTPGRERFYARRQKRYTGSLNESFFQKADAAMLVYDMTKSTSFTQLLQWYADLLALRRSLPVIVVANKLDLYQADLQRARHLVHPRRVAQRDVLGLQGDFVGNDFCYESQVCSQAPASGGSQSSFTKETPQRRMEISSFLANRENWTSDGGYLESLLNSEDESHPDLEMVLLWCMRNGLTHVQVSAATGEHVSEAMEKLAQIALQGKQDAPSNSSISFHPPINMSAVSSVGSLCETASRDDHSRDNAGDHVMEDYRMDDNHIEDVPATPSHYETPDTTLMSIVTDLPEADDGIVDICNIYQSDTDEDDESVLAPMKPTETPPPRTPTTQAFTRRNPSLNLQERYASKRSKCACFCPFLQLPSIGKQNSVIQQHF